MGIQKFLSATWRTLKLTRKSDKEEFFLYMKLVLLGFAIVGVIGFVVYFVAAEIELVNGISNPAGTSTPAILFRALLGV